MSLDDDNLSLAAKKSDRNDRSSSLKDAAHGTRQDRGRIEMDNKKEKGFKEIQPSGVKKSSVNRRDSDPDKKSPLRETAEPKFTVVMRKRKNKTVEGM